jgi:hypothetical protein
MGALLPLVIQETPAIISALKDLFQQRNPAAPVPTDEEIMQAFERAFQSSRAKDDLWLSQHPAL